MMELANQRGEDGTGMVITASGLEEIRKVKYENHLLGWQEYQQGKLVLEAMPSRAFIELTKNCNFKCVMCWQSRLEEFREYHPEYDMPWELFTRVADTLFPYLMFADLRGYGETTILPYWPEVVEYLSSFPLIQWHLNTNLSMPRADVWDLMMRNNFMIAFSCDGATKQTFEWVRRGSNFDQIRTNLGVVTDAIRRHKSGAIYFLVTVGSYNLLELPAIVTMAHEFGVGTVAIRIVREENPLFRLIPDQPEEVIRLVLRETAVRARECRLSLDINDAELAKFAPPDLGSWEVENPTWFAREPFPYVPFRHRSEAVSVNQKCFKPFGYVYVYHDGRVGPCNHLSFPPVPLGDLKRDSFEAIWNGTLFQKFRASLLEARPKLPDCKWCFAHRVTD